MSINSKQKGAKGERELANILKEYGYNTRRGQQYNGLEGEDVVRSRPRPTEWRSQGNSPRFPHENAACKIFFRAIIASQNEYEYSG